MTELQFKQSLISKKLGFGWFNDRFIDTTSRNVLEEVAKEVVSSELYYDLCDNIDSVTDNDLCDIIACNGVYSKELKLT